MECDHSTDAGEHVVRRQLGHSGFTHHAPTRGTNENYIPRLLYDAASSDVGQHLFLLSHSTRFL
jgi:hypothetical protein